MQGGAAVTGGCPCLNRYKVEEWFLDWTAADGAYWCVKMDEDRDL